MEIVGAHVILYGLLKTRKRSFIQAVLLYKRTQDVDIHPGYWALFGGKREKNQSPEETIRRELEEELRVNGKGFKNLEMYAFCDVFVKRGNGKHIISYYAAPLDVKLDKLGLKMGKSKVEGEGLGWFTAEEIHHLSMRPEDRIAINRFFQESGI